MMHDDEQRDRVWAIVDVAEYLQVPISSIYKMTAPKARIRIPHVRISGRLRFKKADIDRWLELLTVSNVDGLARVAKAAAKVNAGHGIDPSKKTA